MPKIMFSKATLVGAALLLSTTALGVTLAAASDHRRQSGGDAGLAVSDGRERPVRIAGEHGARAGHDGQHRRHSDNDDDEGDDDDEGGAGGAGQARRSGPDVPVPDNGLFNGKARPKVDVQ